MGKAAFIFTVSIFISLTASTQSKRKPDTIAHCSLGKIASKEKENQLRKSECLQYCINAFAATEAQYEQDGTVSKSVCQWGSKDLLVLGGFTNENSPETETQVAKNSPPQGQEKPAPVKTENRPMNLEPQKPLITNAPRVPASVTPPPPPPPAIATGQVLQNKASGKSNSPNSKKDTPPSPKVFETVVSEPPRTISSPPAEPPRF